MTTRKQGAGNAIVGIRNALPFSLAVWATIILTAIALTGCASDPGRVTATEFQCPDGPGNMGISEFIGVLSTCTELASR